MREKNNKIYLLIPSFSQPHSLLAKPFTSHLRRVKNCLASDTLKDLLEKSKLCGHVRMEMRGSVGKDFKVILASSKTVHEVSLGRLTHLFAQL